MVVNLTQDLGFIRYDVWHIDGDVSFVSAGSDVGDFSSCLLLAYNVSELLFTWYSSWVWL